MRITKERLTVTVDPHLVQAATEAVAEGRADSLSAWVNLALAERAEKERRLRAPGEAVAAYEARFGIISAEEIAMQARADRELARDIRRARTRAAAARRPCRRRVS